MATSCKQTISALVDFSLLDRAVDLVGELLALVELRLGERRAQRVGDLFRLAKVDRLHDRSQLDLHVLDHAANVDDVRLRRRHLVLLLLATRQTAGEVHFASVVILRFETEHHSRRQRVVGRRLVVGDLDDVNRVPSALHRLTFLGLVLRLLDQNARGKVAAIEIPAIHRRHAAFIVQIAVDIKDLVCMCVKKK